MGGYAPAVSDETRPDGTETAPPGDEAVAAEPPPAGEVAPFDPHSAELEPHAASADLALLYTGARSAEDREWTHDPLERSFFSAVGRGYLVGIVLLGLFGFLVTRTQARGWGVGAAIGVGIFVALWAGVLGAVVEVGRWAMRNEEMIRGNETGHAHPSGEATTSAHPDEPSDPESSADSVPAATETAGA